MERIATKWAACLLMAGVLLFVAWLAGITPDGLLYGQWPENADHPTNWSDTVLHPDAK